MRETLLSLWTNFKSTYLHTKGWNDFWVFYQAFLKHLSISFYVMNGSWTSREIASGKKSKCFAWKEFAPLWTWSANTYIVEYVVLCSSDIWTKQLWVYEACQPSMQLCCYRFVCYPLKLVLNQNVIILGPSHYPYKTVPLPGGNRVKPILF